MKGITSSLKQNFIAGILVTAPFGLTIFILYKFGTWIVDLISALPSRYISFLTQLPEWLQQFATFFIGLTTTVLVVVIIGAITKNFLGNKLLTFGEYLISKIPLARTIYMATKQIVETLFVGTGMKNLKKVALFEYPRKGIYSIGFVTGNLETGDNLNISGGKLISIFVPTAPNPTSGYFIMLPEEDVTELSISVEDAFRIILSAGLSTNTPRKLNDAK